jgi:biopolymer transport protein ExbD
MLALLIIFIIAAPIATVDVAANLPSSNVDPRPRPDQAIFLTIKSDLTLWFG